jgi:hypothetical protein
MKSGVFPMRRTLITMKNYGGASSLFTCLSALALACTAAAQHAGGAAHAAPPPSAPHIGFASHQGPSPASRGSGAAYAPASRGAYGSTSLFPSPGITSTRPVYFSNGIARYSTPDHRGPRYGYNGGSIGALSLGYPGYLGFDDDPDFLNPTYNPNTAGDGSGLLPEAVINPQPPVVNYGGYPEPGYGSYPQSAYPPSSYPESGYPQPTEQAAANPEPEPVPTPFLAPPVRHTAAPKPAPLPEEDAVTIVFKDGRPNEQIRNYALTRTALYITAGKVRTIPVDDIDLAATEKANAKAGVDFQLPTK